MYSNFFKNANDFVAQFSNEACKMKAECEAL